MEVYYKISFACGGLPSLPADASEDGCGGCCPIFKFDEYLVRKGYEVKVIGIARGDDAGSITADIRGKEGKYDTIQMFDVSKKSKELTNIILAYDAGYCGGDRAIYARGKLAKEITEKFKFICKRLKGIGELVEEAGLELS